MVNTFLVVSDFASSAALLDDKRLGKQRVEAMQIYHNLVDLNYLSDYFSIPYPPRGADKEAIYQWYDDIMSEYKNLSFSFRWIDTDNYDESDPIKVDKSIKFIRAKDSETVTQTPDGFLLTTKGGNRRLIPTDQFLPRFDRIVGEGLRKHPVLVLWHTYLPALQEYINVHIDEWIKRGFNNTMKRYSIDSTEIEYPPWVNNPEFHRTMRARLREKELTSIEEYQSGKRKIKVTPWYTTQTLFLNSGEDTGYLW